MPLTLDHLNTAPLADALQCLDGLYEHSPWIAQAALAHRPFVSVHQLKHRMTQVLDAAGHAAQVDLIRAHPELAGKAMVSKTLTAESTGEQRTAGLTDCTPEEFATLQQLNTSYNAKFGWPFILAVRGPRGTGLGRAEIMATFARRLQAHPEVELQECLRQIHRIAEIRLNDKLGITPTLGHEVWDWQEALSQHSEPGFAEHGQLTVTYLTDAHRACAESIARTMTECGFDSVHTDAVGNVVGRYETNSFKPNEDVGYRPKKLKESATLLTGSHYDTVRNAGKYDGRLGIFVPMACVRELHRQQRRLPFAIEVVAFAEEEGQRFKATFLGSGALVGDFKTEWLTQRDTNGITLQAAMEAAGLRVQDIPSLQRDPANYLGFLEVHIEQGPVLNALNLPLGVVTSINASVRYTGEVMGTACHAGTTPMAQRQDAACTVAEFMLALEALATQAGDAVATVGQLHVPNGSVNVVPGCCQFSIDLRAPSNAQRDQLEANALATLDAICQRRKVSHTLVQSMRASAAPSAAPWQLRWEAAVTKLGLPVHRMPSGAGHDAMKLHEVMPQAMLFVRGQNAGISHNPLESTTSDDMQLAVEAFSHLLEQLASDTAAD